jgi:protein gp37
VFCASFADVFEAREDLAPYRAKLWGLIWETPELDWLLLTKRPEHAGLLATEALRSAKLPASQISPWLSNIWLGTTAEDQAHYEQRWAHLAMVPAAVRFISHEPALGPLSVLPLPCGPRPRPRPDWVITGGESGPRARPYVLQWASELVAQCREVDIACFVKQLGAHPLGLLGELQLRDKKGGDVSEWPEQLRVQQWPRGPGC